MSDHQEQTLEFFEAHSETWPANYRKKRWFKQRVTAFSELIGWRRSRGDLALDLGCGTGEVSLLLGRHGLGVVLLDRSPKMLEGAGRLLSDHRVSHRAVLADLNHLPFRDGLFDLILCSSVYEYVEDTALFWHEIRRVLKVEGDLLISVPNRESIIRKLEHGMFRMSAFLGRIRRFKSLVSKVDYLSIQERQCRFGPFHAMVQAMGFDMAGFRFFGTPLMDLRKGAISRRIGTMLLCHLRLREGS